MVINLDLNKDYAKVRFVRNPRIKYRCVSGKVVIHPGIVLNTTASVIWELSGERRTVDEIVDFLSKFKNSPSRSEILKGVLRIAHGLSEVGALTEEERNTPVQPQACEDIPQSMIGEILASNRQAKFEEWHPITRMDLVVTRGCNLRCRHCFISAGVPKKNELGLEEWKEAIDKICTLGLIEVMVTGGEPFSYPGIFELLEYLKRKGLEFYILTNGLLVDGFAVQELSRLRPYSVQVSLEGASKETHEQIRGKDTFDRTIGNIERLSKAGCRVTISTVATEVNYDELVSGRMADLAMRIGAKLMGVSSCMVKVGRAVGNWTYNLDIDKSLRLIDSLHQQMRDLKDRIVIRVGAPPVLSQDVYMLKSFGKKARGDPICSNGVYAFSVDSDGTIVVCTDFVPLSYEPYIIGNIISDNLETIMQKFQAIRQERIASGERLKGVCSICNFKQVCLGSCRADAYAHYKDIDGPYPLCQQAYDAGIFPKDRLMRGSETNGHYQELNCS